MATRSLKESIENVYFKEPQVQQREEDGFRDMGPLYPFIISGGENTEYYYFKHISNTSQYKFNIKPEYFCDESRYTEVFPLRIKAILTQNNDAKIYCVFDFDTVIKEGDLGKSKHQSFIKLVKKEINKGQVIICESMPCIEYWFLLHFENYTELIKTCGKKLQKKLSPYMVPLFPKTNKKTLRILKDRSFLCNSEWVVELCKDGKLEYATQIAEANYIKAKQNNTLNKESYTKVYQIFKDY